MNMFVLVGVLKSENCATNQAAGHGNNCFVL